MKDIARLKVLWIWFNTVWFRFKISLAKLKIHICILHFKKHLLGEDDSRTVQELQFPIAGLYMLILGFFCDILRMTETRTYDCISNVLLNTNQAKVKAISVTSQPKCLPLWRQRGFFAQRRTYLEYPLHQFRSWLWLNDEYPTEAVSLWG